jgi:hypothetical protein
MSTVLSLTASKVSISEQKNLYTNLTESRTQGHLNESLMSYLITTRHFFQSALYCVSNIFEILSSDSAVDHHVIIR